MLCIHHSILEIRLSGLGVKSFKLAIRISGTIREEGQMENEDHFTQYAIELYKLCCADKDEYEDFVSEFGWINDEEFCVWVGYPRLKEFIDVLKEIFGYDLFDDGGFSANIQSDGVCIDLCQALNSFMDIETVFPKKEYRH